MSLKRQVAQNTIVQIIGKGVSTFLGVLTIMIMTRALSVEQFGWYITASGYLQFFGIISDFGFTVVTANMLSEPSYDKKKLLDAFFTIRFFTALLLNCVAPLSILIFPYPPQIKIATIIMTLSFFCVYINQIFVAYYQVKLKMHIQAIGEVIGRLALVLGAVLAWQRHWGFLPLMTFISLAAICNTFYLWKNSEGVRFCWDKNIARAIWKKMWPVAVAILFNAFYLQGDKIILPLHASQSDVGIYGAASRVVETIIPIPALLMGTMLPLLTYSWSRNNLADFKERAGWSFSIVNLFILPTVAGILAISTPLMIFVASGKYAQSGLVLTILAWKLIGVSVGLVFSHFLLATGKQKQYMWVYAADAILSTIGFLIFIPRFGIYGAAAVSLFSEIFAGATLATLCIYLLKFMPDVIGFLKIFSASAIMGLVVYKLQPLNIAWSILIGGSLYIALIFILGVINRQMIRELISYKSLPSEPPSESPVV